MTSVPGKPRAKPSFTDLAQDTAPILDSTTRNIYNNRGSGINAKMIGDAQVGNLAETGAIFGQISGQVLVNQALQVACRKAIKTAPVCVA